MAGKGLLLEQELAVYAKIQAKLIELDELLAEVGRPSVFAAVVRAQVESLRRPERSPLLRSLTDTLDPHNKNPLYGELRGTPVRDSTDRPFRRFTGPAPVDTEGL